MEDHPFRNNKDELIRDLRKQIDELVKENIELERKNKERNLRRFVKGMKWTGAVLAVLALLGGMAYSAYLGFKKSAHYHRKCSELCGLVLGHISLMGETYSAGCQTETCCSCITVYGATIKLKGLSEERLDSDLAKQALEFDVEQWHKCVDLSSKINGLICNEVPRKMTQWQKEAK